MCKQAQVAVRERIKAEQVERERAQETNQADSLQLQKVIKLEREFEKECSALERFGPIQIKF